MQSRPFFSPEDLNPSLNPLPMLGWISRQRAQVLEFIEAQKHITVSTVPRVPKQARVQLRAKLIVEECIETAAAMVGDTPDVTMEEITQLLFDKMAGKRLTLFSAAKALLEIGIECTPTSVDMAEFADGCIDSMYVIIGALIEFGVDDTHIFDHVHAANMRKFIGARRERGDTKTLKPEGWKAADVSALLRDQGWDGSNVGDLHVA